jgi:hypothetical protein
MEAAEQIQEGPETGEGDRNAVFAFEHKVFSVEGAYFAAPDGRDKPKFFLPMGTGMGSVDVSALRGEFGIAEDSADGALLDLVEKSLKYVKAVRPNESIPREVLDGTASWSVEEHHRDIAQGRITAQLIAMMSGDDSDLDDATAIERLIEDRETKVRLDEAFAEAAEKLGLGRNNKQEVVNWIELLAHEMSYIEGLREHFADLRSIRARLKNLLTMYGKEGLAEDIRRTVALIQEPLTEYGNLFDQVDGQTCEIMVVLREVERQVQMIRQIRDELHYAFLKWTEMVDLWDGVDLVRNEDTDDRIRTTYQFVARNFQQSQSWDLISDGKIRS